MMRPILLPTKLNVLSLKHACLSDNTREGHIKVCKLVVPSSLVSYIGNRIFWENNNNTVSLGSSFQDAVELDEIRSPNDYDGSMDCDDVYFAEHGMRYATLLHQYNTNTYITSVLKCCLATLNYSSILCNLFNISNSM